MRTLWRLIEDEEGGMIVEAALVLVLVSMAAFMAYQSLGGTVAGLAGRGMEGFGGG